MHGARLVSTPAIKRIGSAVSGLDDNRAEMPEKSSFFVGKGKTTKQKLPAWGPQPKACCRELQQRNGQRSVLAVFPARRCRLKAASRQPVVFLLQLLPSQNLLEQIQCSRITRLPKPEHCLLSDLGIPVVLRNRDQRRNPFIARSLRERKNRLLPHLAIDAVVYDDVGEPARRRLASGLTDPKHRLRAGRSWQVLIAGDPDQRRPDICAIDQRRREHSFLAHAASLGLSHRQQIIRGLASRHHAEVDNIRTGRSPAAANVKPHVTDLAATTIDDQSTRTLSAIVLPFDVARDLPVVAPRRATSPANVTNRIAIATDVRAQCERHAYGTV